MVSLTENKSSTRNKILFLNATEITSIEEGLQILGQLKKINGALLENELKKSVEFLLKGKKITNLEDAIKSLNKLSETETEKEQLESKLSNEKLQELVKEYRESLQKGEDAEEALNDILRENKNISKRDIEQFIKVQNEFRQEFKKNTEKIAKNLNIKKNEESEKETKEKIKAEIEKKIDELSQKVVDEVKGDIDLKKRVKVELVKTVKQEEYRDKKEEITDLSKAIAGDGEKNVSIEVLAKQTQLEINKWQEEHIQEVREYRKDNFREKIEKETRNLNPEITEEKMALVIKEANLISEIYFGDKGIENQKDQAFESNANLSTVKKGRAWTDIQGIISLIKKSPKEVEQIKGEYQKIKTGLDGITLPFNIKELSSFEGIMNSLQDPLTNKLFGKAKNYLVWADRIDNLTGGWVKRTVVEVGTNFATKIGNQAVSSFIQNSMGVLAEQGFKGGFETIMKGVFSGGVKAAGSAAVKAGASAAVKVGTTVAAEAALTTAEAVTGPPGWVVFLITTAIQLVLAVGGIFKKIGKSISDKLGTNLGIKDYFKENFGPLGGVLAVPATMGVGAIVAVSLAVFFGYQMLQNYSLVASLVPPTEQNAGPDEETAGSDPGSDSTVIGETKCSVADKVVLTPQCGVNRNIKMRADGTCPSRTTCTSGCGPTSVSEILQGRNQSLTINYLMTDSESPYYNTYSCNQGTSWGQATKTLKKYLGDSVVGGVLSGCSINDVRKLVCSGHAVMILLKWTNDDGSRGGHYVVAVAVDNNDNLIIKDPGNGKVNVYPTAATYQKHNKKINSCLGVDVGLSTITPTPTNSL